MPYLYSDADFVSYYCYCTFHVFVVSVEMYKCDLLASTCGTCLTLAAKYACVWCDDQCKSESSCQSSDIHILTREDGVCPDPQILSVSIIQLLL